MMTLLCTGQLCVWVQARAPEDNTWQDTPGTGVCLEMCGEGKRARERQHEMKACW